MATDQKTTKHLEFLDVLRGVAIFWVFVSHCLGVAYGNGLPQLGSGWFRDFGDARLPIFLFPLINGAAGVAIFFVISGFCIHLSYLRGRPGDWAGFFNRRFFRIYPPYLAALLLFAFCLPKTRMSFHPSFDWGQFLSHVFLLHNANPDWIFGINGSFWTIAVEAQLYVLYPVLLVLVAKAGWQRTLFILGAVELCMRVFAGVVWVTTGQSAPQWFVGMPIYFWFSWSVGAALADAYVRGIALPFARWSPWPWLVLGIITPAVNGAAAFTFPCLAMATAVVIARNVSGEPVTLSWVPGIVTAHLRRLGVWSYACYLLHQPVITLVEYAHLKIHIPPALEGPGFSLAICLGLYPLIVWASAIFRRYVELPSIAWGKWFLQRSGKLPASNMTSVHTT